MRGVFSGGVVTGLEELGLTETFDDVIGVSVGASSAAYFLARQARLGTRLFSEELTNKEFINLLRVRNILNVNYLETIFTTGNKVLDIEAIRNSRSRLFVGVTNVDTAQPEYIDVSDLPDSETIKVIQASSAVPGLTPPVEYAGGLYGDGITACRNPIRFAIEELGSTDILTVINTPLRPEKAGSLGERALSTVLTRGYSPTFREAYNTRHYRSDETATTQYDTNIRIGVLAPEEKTISRLERNTRKIIQVALQAEKQTITALS